MVSEVIRAVSYFLGILPEPNQVRGAPVDVYSLVAIGKVIIQKIIQHFIVHSCLIGGHRMICLFDLILYVSVNSYGHV